MYVEKCKHDTATNETIMRTQFFFFFFLIALLFVPEPHDSDASDVFGILQAGNIGHFTPCLRIKSEHFLKDRREK